MYKLKQINAYHGTLDCFSKIILESGFALSPPKPTDNHWLGHGIYFFKYFDHAKWWSNEKTKTKQGTTPVIIKATINYKRYLDLDNPTSLTRFKRDIKCIYNNIIESNEIIIESYDSKILFCILIDYYKLNNKIDLIVRTFNKEMPSYGTNVLIEINGQSRKLSDYFNLNYNELQYCVTHPKSIKNISIV